MDAAASNANVQSLHAALAVVQMLNLTAWRYPPPCTITDGASYDFIIVGAGTAGSVLANRLTQNSNVSVLLVEEGGYPPVEAEDFPGLFPLLPGSMYDYNYATQNDGYSAQNLQGSAYKLTAGKMIGGSGSIDHLLYTRGFPHDYNEWARLLGDDSWNYENSLKYFEKIENLKIRDLRASPYYDNYFGTNGMIDITRESHSIVNQYLEAFRELGQKIENVTTMLSYADTLFTIADGVRQSTSLKYLSATKSRTNLCMSLFTTATKILIEDGIAIGVEVTISNNKYTVYANKEVILSAGVIGSPKLLMLSGIGPRAHLESLGIKVVADLPVGQNFQDQIPAIVLYEMEKSSEPPPPTNPHKFSIPTFIGAVAFNSTQKYPDVLTYNIIVPQNSPSLAQFCGNIFKYTDKICQKMIDANKDRVLLFVINCLSSPKSLGKVLLASADPHDTPLIYPGTFSNKSDLKLLAKSLKDYDRVRDTKYFKSVNATMLDLGLCSSVCSKDTFLECNALKMSASIYHYGRTCAMGVVLDSSMRVKGVDALRVMDASSMPLLTSVGIFAAVNMLAEHGADLILSEWNIAV